MKHIRFFGVALAFCLAACNFAWAQTANTAKIGAGTIYLAPKEGDRPVPKAKFRTDALLKTAAQTGQWYTSQMFYAQPEVLQVHPLSVKATPAGVEFVLPAKEVLPTVRQDVEIRYPHRDPLVISPVAFKLGQSKVSKVSDWSLDMTFARGQDEMLFTVAHGSPYVSLQISRGDVRLRLPVAGDRFDSGDDARILALRVNGKPYALFGPTGMLWKKVSPTEWVGLMPSGKGYVSAAGLPDDRPDTLALFTRHAYAFIDDTRAEWKYDQATSKVDTTFNTVTKIMEGPDNGPLLGLYPHQWYNNDSVQSALGQSYDTIRGKIKLIEASQFKTSLTYNGFVPYWPAVIDSPRKKQLDEVITADVRNARRMMLEEGKGPYWQGKGLHRILKLMDVVEQQGDLAGRDRLLAMVKERAEQWLTGQDRTYFLLDKSQGAIASYPEEYYFVEQMNDHHFVYGYWIRAAADIALRDPSWIAKDKWGGMIDLLVGDIATLKRNGADFPFMRNFDPYEGHSWASGMAFDEFGGNQESSSEAMNAWAALILWAEITGNRELRDLGVYLYTTEINSINHYWFNLYGQVFAPEYKSLESSIVFGGKYVHNTWWTDEPRQIKGINLLPITTASTYLGRNPDFVKRSLATLKPETDIYLARGKKANPPDMWQDIFAKYMGLADPDLGLAQWNRWGSFELGDTRTHTLHYLLSLQEMGTPDFDVTANTTFYSVFKRADGHKTYLAFNAGKTPIDVTFSDGKTLTVAPNTLGQLK